MPRSLHIAFVIISIVANPTANPRIMQTTLSAINFTQPSPWFIAIRHIKYAPKVNTIHQLNMIAAHLSIFCGDHFDGIPDSGSRVDL